MKATANIQKQVISVPMRRVFRLEFVLLLIAFYLVSFRYSSADEGVGEDGEGKLVYGDSGSLVKLKSSSRIMSEGRKEMEHFRLLWLQSKVDPLDAFINAKGVGGVSHDSYGSKLYSLLVYAMVIDSVNAAERVRDLSNEFPEPLLLSAIDLIKDLEVFDESEFKRWHETILKNVGGELAVNGVGKSVRTYSLRSIVSHYVWDEDWTSVRGVARHWANTDFASFLKWSIGARDQIAKMQIDQELDELCSNGYQALFQKLEAIGSSHDLQVKARQAYLPLIDLDLERAVQIINLTNHNGKIVAAQDICDHILKDNRGAEKILKIWEALEVGQLRIELGRAMVADFITRQPEHAKKFMEMMNGRGAPLDDYINFARVAGRLNGEASLELGNLIENKEMRREYLKCAGHFWGQFDPVKACRWITNEIEGGTDGSQEYLFSAIRDQALSFDSGAVFDSIKSINDNQVRYSLQVENVALLSKIDPVLASEELLLLFNDSEVRDRAEMQEVSLSVVSRLINRDESSAKRLVSEIPEGLIRGRIARLLIDRIGDTMIPEERRKIEAIAVGAAIP